MITAQYIADHVALLKMSKSTVAKPSVTIIEALQAMVTEQNAVLQAQQVELDEYRARDAMIRKQGGGAAIEAATYAMAGVALPTPNQLPPPVVTPAPTPVPAPSAPPITPQVAFDIMTERTACAALAMAAAPGWINDRAYEDMDKPAYGEAIRVNVAQRILARTVPVVAK